MIRIQAVRAHVEIDGVKYFPGWKVARLAEILLQANGELVGHDRLELALGTQRKVVQVYTSKLRGLLSPYGYVLRVEPDAGYRLLKPDVSAVRLSA